MNTTIMSRSQSSLQRLGILVSCNLLNLTLINSAIAQPEILSEPLRTITVTGRGIETIATSVAEVTLGVEIQGKTAAQVQQEIAVKTNAAIELLRSKDVEQLQTTGVRLDPRYEQFDRNSNQDIIGYVGTNTVSFRIPTEQVGSLLDEAVAAGVTRIDRISFTATTEAISIAKEKALRQATVDAQSQAEIVLETLDLSADEIVKIEIDRTGIQQPQPYASGQFAASESRISTPIIGGEQTVEADVTLQISY